MKLGRLLVCLLSLFTIAACSSGGGGGSEQPVVILDDDVDIPGLPDFGATIDPDSCQEAQIMKDPFFQKDPAEEFISHLNTGDAACAKLAIELGKLDVNKKYPDVFGRDPMLPVFRALQDSELFFANANSGAFSVLKVLVEAGARLDVVDENGDTPLLYALKSDKVTDYPSAHQYLVQTGEALPNKKDRKGNSAFHYSIVLKNIDSFKLFIANQADLNSQSQSGLRPIHGTLTEDWEEGAMALLNAGADMSVQDPRGDTPLHVAISKDFNELSSALVAGQTVEVLNLLDDQNYSTLAMAVIKQNSLVTEALLARGVNANTLTQYNDSIAHLAMKWANHAVVGKLIAVVNDANLDVQNQEGKTALYLAVENQNLHFMDLLIARGVNPDKAEKSNGQTALHLASKTGGAPALTKLLNGNANADLKDSDGNTALHMSIIQSTSAQLIAKMSSIDVENNKGVTPVAQAVLSKRQQSFLVIANAGAKLDWMGQGKQTLLHLAAKGQLDTAKYLVTKLDVNAQTERGSTPLHLVSSVNMLNIILSANPNLEIADSNGDTAFTQKVGEYVYNPTPEMLQIVDGLLKAGSNVNHTSQNGETVIFEAVVGGHKETPYLGDLMQLLLQQPIDLNVQNAKQRTVLFYVDTKQEVIDLRRGSKLGPIDLTLTDSQSKTAEDSFERDKKLAEYRQERNEKNLAEKAQELQDAIDAGADQKVIDRLEIEKNMLTTTVDVGAKNLNRLNGILAELRI